MRSYNYGAKLVTLKQIRLEQSCNHGANPILGAGYSLEIQFSCLVQRIALDQVVQGFVGGMCGWDCEDFVDLCGRLQSCISDTEKSITVRLNNKKFSYINNLLEANHFREVCGSASDADSKLC